MHLRPISRKTPAQAVNVLFLLDFINQLIGTIRALEVLFGFDLAELLDKDQQEA